MRRKVEKLLRRGEQRAPRTGDGPARAVRIVLVDDHTLLREGIKAIFKHHPGLRVVGEAGTIGGARDLVRKHHPDIVLLDLGLPDGSGLDFLAELKARRDWMGKTVVLSMDDSATAVERAFGHGASGYISKQSSHLEVIAAMKDVALGRTYIGRNLLGHVAHALQHRRGPGGAAQAFESPTAREREVLEHVAGGLNNKEIAQKLGISLRTVEKHRDNARRRLGLRGTAGLMAWAVRNLGPGRRRQN